MHTTDSSPTDPKVKMFSKLTEMRRSPSPSRTGCSNSARLDVSPRYMKDYELRKVQANEGVFVCVCFLWVWSV